MDIEGLTITQPSRGGQIRAGFAPSEAAKTYTQTAVTKIASSCAYLAAAVFVGLAGNALFGAWWLDPIAALVIAAIAVREGLETWRGEGCCAGPPLGRPAEAACEDDCCDSPA